jgi:5-hydroxyisourate hydrolase
MSGITTHILDIARGRPAAGVAVSLARRAGDGWTEVATARSDTDGRVANLLPGDATSPPLPGTYRLRFDTGVYFTSQGVAPFHPFVEIVFDVRDAEPYHVPLLVSPFGYTTYRGS